MTNTKYKASDKWRELSAKKYSERTKEENELYYKLILKLKFVHDISGDIVDVLDEDDLIIKDLIE